MDNETSNQDFYNWLMENMTLGQANQIDGRDSRDPDSEALYMASYNIKRQERYRTECSLRGAYLTLCAKKDLTDDV